MHYAFPYPDFPPIDIPEENLMGAFPPSILEIEKTEEEIIKEAMFHPVGSAPLDRMLTGKENVLMVVDDDTRSTPAHEFSGVFVEVHSSIRFPQTITF